MTLWPGELVHLWNDTEWAITLQHQHPLRTRTDGHGWVSVAEVQQETALHHSGHSGVSRSAAANGDIPPRFIWFVKQEFSSQEIFLRKMSGNKVKCASANVRKVSSLCTSCSMWYTVTLHHLSVCRRNVSSFFFLNYIFCTLFDIFFKLN